MTKSLSARLLVALDRPEIPPHIRRAVHNAVFGADAEDPPKVAWDNLYSTVQVYLRTLRSNKRRVRPDLLPVWLDYYDTVAAVPAQIREADKSAPPTKELSQWQGWVPEATRKDFYARFEQVYTARPTNGGRIIPFAPLVYRQANTERIKRCVLGIASARGAWNTKGTKSNPASHLLLGAVILSAARQAEIALDRYQKGLKDYTIHPYEEPAKAQWQQYCDAETRAKVRRLSANPGDVYFDTAPYAAFLKA